jgi:CDP-glucose 4,6-dehydratase
MRFFNDIYKDRRVFLTGHTGFKGSWLACWLSRWLGAKVCGFSDDQKTEPHHYSLLKDSLDIDDHCGDIRHYEAVARSLCEFQPEIVFHFAAQPLVRRSYKEPLETFSTNTLGTANILQSARQCDSVKAVVIITTDKVYENLEVPRGYKETDVLGGYDPYAASKACAEIVVNSFRRSFYETEKKLLASCRAGNVVGGGDWAEDRLIPDIVRSAARGDTTFIRMPGAVRPWEHVLEPISGYLLLGQYLLEGKSEFAEAWNFGPDVESNVTVGEVVKRASEIWNKIHIDVSKEPQPHETTLLMLDCEKAKTRLNWKPVWNLQQTIEKTVEWYREFYEHGTILTWEQLEEYIDKKERGA